MSEITEIQQLRSEVEDLRAALEVLKPAPPEAEQKPEPQPDSDQPTIVPLSAATRRNWLKGAAAVVVGGTAAALAQSDRVAAANGDNLVLGNTGVATGKQVATSPTQINYTGTEDIGFLVQAGTQFNATSSSVDAALAGWSVSTVNPVGVYGFSDSGAIGDGVRGNAGFSARYGVHATHFSSGGTALRAAGGGTTGTGVNATGGTAVRADGSLYGATLSGGLAALLLSPATTEPPGRTSAHIAGELEATAASASDPLTLWLCTKSGTPGTWQKLGGTATAGALHALAPIRVYDSRVAAPTPGRLASGDNRVVSVADSRDAGNGSVVAANAIPVGATAVTFNITIAATAARGFLSVTPGDAASSPSSTINWSAPDSIVANAGVVQLDDSRQIKVFAGGGGSTDFIVDITGYYL